MPINPAWIQAGSQLLSSGLNSIFHRRAQQREFKNNRAMSELAYNQDLDMWNRQSQWNREQWDIQNEYNLPANQMQRLRDAGLNPNLIYGNGAAGGQAGKIDQATMPKYNPARANYSHLPVNIPDMLGQYQNFKLKNAQIDNVEAQTRVAKEKALTEMELRAGRYDSYKYGNQIKYHNARYQEAFNELERDRRKQQVENMRTDGALKKLDIPYRRDRNTVKNLEAQLFKEKGIRPQDAMWMRLMLRLYDNAVGSNLGRLLFNSDNWKSSRIFGDN